MLARLAHTLILKCERSGTPGSCRFLRRAAERQGRREGCASTRVGWRFELFYIGNAKNAFPKSMIEIEVSL
jgi:hypothetical protein